MKDIMELLSRLLFTDFNPISMLKGPVLIRILLNLAAFFTLIFGYVLGCKVLYHYLIPYWGEPVALLVICGVLLVTSFLLFIVAWFLKPKPVPAMNFVSELEKTLGDLPTKEIIKKVASMVSPKTVATVFVLATAASYFSKFKKNA